LVKTKNQELRTNYQQPKPRTPRYTGVVMAKLRAAFFTLPTARGWLETLLLFAAFAVVAIPIAYTNHFFSTPIAFTIWLPMAFTAFFIPSLLEEFIWRVLLVPRPGEKYFWRFGMLSLVCYVLAHPLGAWLFRPTARDIFYTPAFLFLAALLGLTCLVAYARTKSLWANVVIHWFVVALWLLFGARGLLET
jgi:predicted Abi (CAAX) family protease